MHSENPGETSPQQVDRLTPFFFGTTGKQLFGLYHVPASGQEQDIGVLLCNPWGQEFVRAHRALSQLGLRLARQGFPVLRFDYLGSGDSSGEDIDGTLTQWQSDIRVAIQELKRRARIDTVIIAGLRLGATLATIVASGRDDVEGLVLWEPVVSGYDYLQELCAWHEEKMFYFLSGTDVAQKKNDSPTELLGFALNPTFIEELHRLDLLTLTRRPTEQLLLVESQKEALTEQLYDHLHTLGTQADYEYIESFQMWTEDPDKGLVPQAILQTILSWVMKKTA